MTDSNGVYWDTKVIDKRTGEKFRLKATDDEIRVYPVDEDFSLGTFYRFYEFVCENVDRNARPVVEDGA